MLGLCIAHISRLCLPCRVKSFWRRCPNWAKMKQLQCFHPRCGQWFSCSKSKTWQTCYTCGNLSTFCEPMTLSFHYSNFHMDRSLRPLVKKIKKCKNLFCVAFVLVRLMENFNIVPNHEFTAILTILVKCNLLLSWVKYSHCMFPHSVLFIVYFK